ncbi:KorB domain-containing protein [uncultured Sulfitobacter sp.]|mgnify:CR=1 FL=1|uniref:KorB domain-containing protein n=1 Tax=uncultured Sulfitobacter sp. TaxID=191468 RepID=UPI0025927777|nr:KorB domain-containing protein [uncultured Sulfitobacter sp.]
MAKAKMPTSKPVDIEAGTFKDALKASEAKTGKMYAVPIGKVRVHPDFNVRIRESENYTQKIDELIASYKGRRANNMAPFMPDSVLVGFVGKDGKEDVIFVTEGHRRLESATQYNADPDVEDTDEIHTLPFVLKPAGTSMSELNLSLIQSNSGDPLTPFEQGVVVKRELNREDGMSKDEIAAVLGVSRRYIDDLELLAGAPAKVRTAVVSDKVSSTLAISELRRDPKEAGARIEAAVQKATSSGKKKATKKHMGPKMAKHRLSVSLAEGETMGATLKSIASQVRSVVQHNPKTDENEPDVLLTDGTISIVVEVPGVKAEPEPAKKPAPKKKAAAKKKPAAKKKKSASDKLKDETKDAISKEADRLAASEDDEPAKMPPKVESDPDVPEDDLSDI